MDQETIEKIKAAQKQIVEASLTLWNARIDALAKAGDLHAIMDDGGSGCGGGGSGCGCGCGCALAGFNAASLKFLGRELQSPIVAEGGSGCGCGCGAASLQSLARELQKGTGNK